MLRVLKSGGRVIIADVMFESEEEKRRIAGEDGITEEIADEYFATLTRLGEICRKLGLKCSFKRINRYVWVGKIEKR